MEQAWTTQQASLVDDWKTEVKTAHVDSLVQAIEAAETLDQLASLEAPALGEQLMSDAMFALADEAGAAAVAEAAAQGVELDAFDSETRGRRDRDSCQCPVDRHSGLDLADGVTEGDPPRRHGTGLRRGSESRARAPRRAE
jgi:hypothetical protein